MYRLHIDFLLLIIMLIGDVSKECEMLKQPVTALALIGLLSSCADFPFENWQQEPQKLEFSHTKLPETASELGGFGLQANILNAAELAEQKRFSEARHILERVRATQEFGSEAYQSLTASMAVLALRAGDMGLFRQDAAALDRTLEDKVRPQSEFVEVVAFHRALNAEPLPVNTPTKLREWLTARNVKRPIELTPTRTR